MSTTALREDINSLDNSMNDATQTTNPFIEAINNSVNSMASSDSQSDNPYITSMNNAVNSTNQNVQQSAGTQLTGQIWPDFLTVSKKIAQERGFPPQVLQAQAALESGRGTSGLTMQDNNYFGIKAHGKYDSSNWNTQEYGNGGYYGENDAFAKYHSPEESIHDYIDLVMSYPGVPEAVATRNPAAVIQAIRNAGYATSPTYVSDVMNTPEFQGGGQ